MKDIQALEGLLAARMPIVAVESHEEAKVLRMIERFAALNDRTLWRWSVTEGLRSIAVAVPDHVGWPAASVAVTFDAARDVDLQTTAARIAVAAAELARRIGGTTARPRATSVAG